jgi:hypothetical protein
MMRLPILAALAGTLVLALALPASEDTGDDQAVSADLVSSAADRQRSKNNQALATSNPTPEGTKPGAEPLPNAGADDQVVVVPRSYKPMQADLFRSPPQPVAAPVAAAPAPAPVAAAPRFTVIGRVIDGGQRQVIVQDGQKVSTLATGQALAGFTLDAAEDGAAIFLGEPAIAGQPKVRHRLEYGKAPVARAGNTPAQGEQTPGAPTGSGS